VTDESGKIIDVKISLPEDYVAQLLEYGKTYGFQF